MVQTPSVKGLFGAVIWLLTGAQTACSQDPAALPVPRPEVDASAYSWIAEWPDAVPPLAPMQAVFAVPENANRVPVAEGTFAAWLRGLPVRTDRSLVLSHDGRPLASHAAAVILLDLGRGDLQQCADTLIRLHAEFLWSSGRASMAAYHFTSGDLSSWPEWVGGVRWAPRGQGVVKVHGAPRGDDHDSYRLWLQRLFVYAGTMSMALDSEGVGSDETIQPGDFFVSPGSPGHTVMVLDVAVTSDGRRLGLIGQGYTPAQELHVIGESSAGVAGGVWFPLPESPDASLEVPSWSPFPRSTARRFTSQTVVGANGNAQDHPID